MTNSPIPNWINYYPNLTAIVYQPGQTVKYYDPKNAEEAALRFTVLEDNGNRVLAQYHVEGWTIQPTATLWKEDISPISQDELLAFYAECDDEANWKA